MKFDDIILIMKRCQSPRDWILVNDEDYNGGNTSFCVEDVLLCIKFAVVWKKAKPMMRYEIRYGTTIVTWFDLPLPSTKKLPTAAAMLKAIGTQISQPSFDSKTLSRSKEQTRLRTSRNPSR